MQNDYLSGQQVIESEVTSGGVRNGGYQYLWSPRYIDAPILRDTLNTAGTGIVTAERLFYLGDANYNVTAVVKYDSGAAQWKVAERYSYDPFGVVTVRGPDWSPITGNVSQLGNTILYTGRTLDVGTGLYYYRARYYDPQLQRFINRDPLVYDTEDMNLYRYVGDDPTDGTDPEGLAACKITIYGGHNYNVKGGVEGDYPNGPPPTDCVTGIGCALPDPETPPGKPPRYISPPRYLCKRYPCNSFPVPGTGGITNPIMGVRPFQACGYMKMALAAAKKAAQNMLNGQPVNPGNKNCPTPQCDSVTIVIKCDPDMTALFQNGTWKGKTLGDQYWKSCQGMCGSSQVIKPE